MLNTIKMAVVVGCCMALGLGCKKETEPATPVDACQVIETPVDACQVKEKVVDAAKTAGVYLDQQKDILLEKAKASYAQLEADTAALLTEIKDTGKQSWQMLTAELNSKLTAAKTQYNALKAAGKEDIQKTGNAFTIALEELKDAYQKTKAEFEEKNTENPE